jgi:hypothetical protein
MMYSTQRSIHLIHAQRGEVEGRGEVEERGGCYASQYTVLHCVCCCFEGKYNYIIFTGGKTVKTVEYNYHQIIRTK